MDPKYSNKKIDGLKDRLFIENYNVFNSDNPGDDYTHLIEEECVRELNNCEFFELREYMNTVLPRMIRKWNEHQYFVHAELTVSGNSMIISHAVETRIYDDIITFIFSDDFSMTAVDIPENAVINIHFYQHEVMGWITQILIQEAVNTKFPNRYPRYFITDTPYNTDLYVQGTSTTAPNKIDFIFQPKKTYNDPNILKEGEDIDNDNG